MGYFSDILATPEARLTSDQLSGLPLSWDISIPLMQQLGGYQATTVGRQAAWMTPGTGGLYEDGTEVGTGVISPEALAKLKDYTFGWAPGEKGAGTLTAFDASGNPAGTFQQAGDEGALAGLLKWGGLAGAGFGLAGLAGFGPLGSSLGGVFGTADAGAGASLAEVGDAAGTGLATSETAGSGITAGAHTVNTITAGSGALGAGGAGLSSGVGLTAPVYAGGGSGLVGGLGMTAGVGGAAAGSGGLSGLLGTIGSYLPAAGQLASIASGVYGMKLAGDARQASDPFAPYRAGYGRKLAALEANPGSITTRPGFQAGLETIGRKSAASGYYGSGNMASALSRYSGDFYTQEANRLAGLAGANTTPGNGQGIAADLASKSLGSIGYGLGPLLQRLASGG